MSLAILVAGCSDGDTSGPTGTGATETTVTTTSPTAAPALEPAPCPDPGIPAERIDCSVLVLPEDRDQPDGRQVELPVLVVHPEGGDRATDDAPAGEAPVVHLHGGPGASAVGSWATWLSLVDGLGTPVVLYDQRGAGAAVPSLDCPEHDTARLEVLADPSGWDADRTRVASALGECHDRLLDEGVALQHYDTPTSAADLDDLRRGLGVDQLRLIGSSAGSRLALHYARTFPDHVAALVLNGVDPPGTGGPSLDRDLPEQAVERFLEHCDRTDCAAGSDPSTLFADAVAQLDTTPRDLPVPATPSTPATTLTVDGDLLRAGLVAALYDSAVIPLVPTALGALAAGTPFGLDAVGAQLVNSFGSTASGATMSVNCADHGVAALAAEPGTAAADPGVWRAVVLNSHDSFCDAWPVPPVGDDFGDAVSAGDVTAPVLVVSGELDPVTPAGPAQELADRLAASHVVVPAGGHAPLLSSGCALDALGQFLAGGPVSPAACDR